MSDTTLAPERAREATYKLLSVCYQLPNKEMQDVKLVEALVEALQLLDSKAVVEAKSMQRIMEKTKDFTPLQVDFSKLFVGPSRLLAAPYGSVYLDEERQLMTESSMKLQLFYNKAGLGIDKENREMPDHIKVELEVMYVFCVNARLADKENNKDDVNKIAEFQRELLLDYLEPWMEPFTKDIEEHAEQEYFKHLARVTRIFISEEKARMSH